MRNLRALAVFVCSCVFAAPALRADIVKYTIDSMELSGFFGTANVSGYWEIGAPVSSISVEEMDNPSTYTYTFTGEVDGPDYTQGSKQPAPPCIIFPCTPMPTYVTFSIGALTSTLAVGQLTDSGEDFSGHGSITESSISGSGPPGSSTPEPAMWPLVLAGLAVMATRRKLLRRSHGL
jgi:hypothetical protein